MKENAVSLEDVVVVGYGVQKKVNVTGAVSMVKAEAIENRPITNVTTGLQDCCLELVSFPLRGSRVLCPASTFVVREPLTVVQHL